MTLTVKKIAAILKTQGFKLTPQRRAILKAISGSHDHLTPAAIYDRVHHEHSGIGLVTIYRSLELLTRLGLLCEVHSGGSRRSYLLRRPAEHHHHLICSDCGTVVDFTRCDLSELEQRLSNETGFKVNGHLLEFLGLCRNCQLGKL